MTNCGKIGYIKYSGNHQYIYSIIPQKYIFISLNPPELKYHPPELSNHRNVQNRTADSTFRVPGAENGQKAVFFQILLFFSGASSILAIINISIQGI